MAGLDSLYKPMDIRHFDNGGSTNDPIAGLYQSVLGRDPDPEGLAYWSGALSSGTSLSDIQNAFMSSPEYQSMQSNAPSPQGNVTVTGAPSYYNDSPSLVTPPPPVDQFGYGVKAQSVPIASGLEQWYQTNLGRAPDIGGLQYWSSQFGETLDPNEIAQLQQSPEYQNRQFVSNLYETELGRKPGEDTGFQYWIDALNKGTTRDDITKAFNVSPEGQVYDFYKEYLNRAPDVAGKEYWMGQLQQGVDPQQIAAGIAQSEESKPFRAAELADLFANQFDESFLDSITKEQMDKFVNIYSDIDAQQKRGFEPVKPEEFDEAFYLKQNPDVAKDLWYWGSGYNHYMGGGFQEGRAPNANPGFMTQEQRYQEVLKQAALDPELGPMMKAKDPYLYESLIPISETQRRVYTDGPFKTAGTGDWGTLKVDGKDVPILNRNSVQFLQPGDKISDFSHGRNLNVRRDIGWEMDGFSSAIARGASAIGVEKNVDPESGSTYYANLDQAAKLLNIDPSQFKDKQVPQISQEVRDEYGNVIRQAGQPVYQTDNEGNIVRDYKTGEPVLATKTITAQDQLYDAINEASKDVYSVTGPNLNFSYAQRTEHNPNAFQTVLYKAEGDKLLPITAPQTHGGMYNLDVYRPKDYGFAYYAQGPMFVGAAALSMMAGDPSLGLATKIGSALLPTAAAGAIGATGVGIVGSAVLGSAIGALSAGGAGGNIEKGALTGGVTGLVASGMKPLMNTGPMQTATAKMSEALGGTFSQAQLNNIVGASLASTLASATSGANGDQILNAFKNSLISAGVSEKATQFAVAGAKEVFGNDEKNIARTAAATRLVTRTATNAALRGANTEQIQAAVISAVVQGAGQIAGAGSQKPTTTQKTETEYKQLVAALGSEEAANAWLEGQSGQIGGSQIAGGPSLFDVELTPTEAAINQLKSGAENKEPSGTVTVNQGITASLADLQEELAAGRLSQKQFDEMVAKNFPESVKETRSLLSLGTPDFLSKYTSLFGSGATAPVSDFYSILSFDSGTRRYVVNPINLTEKISENPELREKIIKDASQLVKDVNKEVEKTTGGGGGGKETAPGGGGKTETTGGSPEKIQEQLIKDAKTSVQAAKGDENVLAVVAVSLVNKLTGNGSSLTGAIKSASDATNLSQEKIAAALSQAGGGGKGTGEGAGTGGGGGTGGGTGGGKGTGTGGGEGAGEGTGGGEGGGTGTGTGGGRGTGTGGGTGGGTGPGTGPGTGGIRIPTIPTIPRILAKQQVAVEYDDYIQNLLAGLTKGMDYSLSGLPTGKSTMSEIPKFQTGGSTTQAESSYNPYAVDLGGIKSSLTPNLTRAQLNYILTGLPGNLIGKAEGGSIEGHNPQFFSEGGLGSIENRYVTGDGDGTSDSIPAMLANGEFVIPADVVSSLGNGSNDAGAEILDEFLRTIREHKRAADARNLPPDSKGPLGYLLEAKRKVEA